MVGPNELTHGPVGDLNLEDVVANINARLSGKTFMVIAKNRSTGGDKPTNHTYTSTPEGEGPVVQLFNGRSLSSGFVVPYHSPKNPGDVLLPPLGFSSNGIKVFYWAEGNRIEITRLQSDTLSVFIQIVILN